MEELGQANVGEEILTPILGVRPGVILQKHLSPQLLGDAQPLQRAEARNALPPIGILRLTDRSPIAADELADATCDHACHCKRFYTEASMARRGRASCSWTWSLCEPAA